MSIQIRNGISGELARRAAIVRDPRPILEAMGRELTSLTKRAFTDASIRAAPWAPLKPATLARKKGRGGILRFTGAMMQSIRITDVTGSSVTVGSDRIQAAIHQLGGRTGRNGAVQMPARPFFPILNGQLTPLARERIEVVGEAKAQNLMR